MKRLAAPVAGGACALAVVLAAVGGLGLAQGAVAAPIGGSGVMQITTDPYPMVKASMVPGESLEWAITTTLTAAATGDLSLQLAHSGPLAANPAGLQLVLRQCDTAWVGAPPATCASGESTILSGAVSAMSTSAVRPLGTITQNDGPYFLATLSLPVTAPNSLQGTSATLGFGFTATGGGTTAPVGAGVLASTGSSPLAPLLLGSGLVLGGLVVARQRNGEARVRP